MKIGKLAATTLFTAAAVGLTAGTAQGAPVDSPSLDGVDHGVSYHTVANTARHSVTTTVANGTVTQSADGQSVVVRDSSGAAISAIPAAGTLAYQGVAIPVRATIGDNGHSLTLASTTVPGLHPVNSQGWFIDSLNNALPGALIGGLIGGLIGLIFFIFGAIPGAIIGAIVGLFAAGGQPLIDSGIAFFSGH